MCDTYLGAMKTKLTLSISRTRIRRVKAYSLRHRKSVSQLFEEMIDALENETSQRAKKVYAIDKLAGIVKRKFTEKELDGDPRLANVMGRR